MLLDSIMGWKSITKIHQNSAKNKCRLIALRRKWCWVRNTYKSFDAIRWHFEWLLLCHVEQIDPHFMEIHFYLYILSLVTSFVKQFMCRFGVVQCDVLCLLTRLVSPFILQDYVRFFLFFSFCSACDVRCARISLLMWGAR